MRFSFIAAGLVLALGTGLAVAQVTGDVLGAHNMAPASGSPITGNLGSPCLYCHAPHSGINGGAGIAGTPLWDQKLSQVQSYQVYSSTTMVNKTNTMPPLGSNSTLCLSCHDGTVALGTLSPYGQVSMTGSLVNTPADLTTNLTSTHPFSFAKTPVDPAPDLWDSLSSSPPATRDATGAVHLINGNVECGSCHNPHVQNIDPGGKFLVIDNSSGSNALCAACHNTTPAGTGMGLGATQIATPAQIVPTNPTVRTSIGLQARTATAAGSPGIATTSTIKRNPLVLWNNSIHATAPNQVANQIDVSGSPRVGVRSGRTASLGTNATVKKNGCSSCHATHNAAPNSLLRGADDQACISCHSGGKNVTPPAPNIYAEMVSPKFGHSFAASNGSNSHSAHESELLNRNRHATCADCHNPHGTKQVGLSFPPAPAIRASQSGVVGISASDGQSVVFPAINQYENCLRCHGTSTGKTANPTAFGYLPIWAVSASDPLNLLLQFSPTATSSHPVMRDRSSPYPQPSLRLNMLNLDGGKQGRSMGTRILCTDCHNSDDNREFGGTGANGPHGSKYAHILERRYDMNQAPSPGQPINNLNVPPNLSTTGNYALCAKCHDLGIVVSNASFSGHARHVNEGFSCSVCHTGHGMGGRDASVSGERLVNFDANVVAPNGTTPISYSRSTNSCSLTCHGHAHNSPLRVPVKSMRSK